MAQGELVCGPGAILNAAYNVNLIRAMEWRLRADGWARQQRRKRPAEETRVLHSGSNQSKSRPICKRGRCHPPQALFDPTQTLFTSGSSLVPWRASLTLTRFTFKLRKARHWPADANSVTRDCRANFCVRQPMRFNALNRAIANWRTNRRRACASVRALIGRVSPVWPEITAAFRGGNC